VIAPYGYVPQQPPPASNAYSCYSSPIQQTYPPLGQYSPPVALYHPPVGVAVMAAPPMRPSFPTNLVIGAVADLAAEPYNRSDIWKIVVLLCISALYGVSFGIAVVGKNGGSAGGLAAPLLFLTLAVAIAWGTSAYEVRFDKTSREVYFTKWRLLTHICGPSQRTIAFDALAGDSAAYPDPSSRQCWCMSATRSILCLRLKTGEEPVVVQSVFREQAAQEAAAWSQYLGDICYASPTSRHHL
jgi:hypothetical protein